MNYEVGTQISDYEILSVLGTGGMGKVYKVRNLISDRIEAMKILLPDLASQQALADRFLREIKVLASLDHPNIAALHTALRVENQLLMIMELVEGVTLSEKLQSGPIPLNDALNYIGQALSALSYAHGQGVIHRDIKPANMMLSPQGTLKLMDFGIARAPSDSKLTMTGTTLGSLHYMSPEQVKGGPLDARSDLYSLGVVLYEIVTGKRPFQESSEFSVMAAHLEKVPQAPVEINPTLPQALNAIILLSLAKDPARRFQSADAFRTALANVAVAQPPLAAPVTATAAETAPSFGLPHRPNPQPSFLEPPSPPSPAMQLAKPPGYRGLYMTLGALLVVLVLAASAIELPHWWRARAGGKSSAAGPSKVSSQGSSAPSQPDGTVLPGAEPASGNGLSSEPASAAPSNASAALPPPSSSTSSSPSSSNLPLNARPASATTPLPAASGVGAGAKRVAHRAASAGSGSTEAAPAETTPATSSNSSAAGRASADATRDQPEGPTLEALQKKMDLLSSRASAVDQSLKQLEQQQASSGLSLRGDVSASWIRMRGFMDRADAALSQGQTLAAKRSMDLAEREIDFLESFLGR
jgi:serine/threonine protein kinase